jgi:biotin carboxylase
MTGQGDPVRELLLVGVGRMGRPYVAAARRLGVKVNAVEAAARAAAVSDQLDELQVGRGELDEHWAEAAHSAVQRRRPDAVVAFSEPQVMGAALLQESLGLPGPSLHAAVLSRNKALQRGTFAAAGIAQPDYLLTGDLAGSAEWVAERLPVVVKPLSSAGSAGVELVADLDAFHAVAARRATEVPLLVETAVEGLEYSWEALVVDGAVWSANVTAKETSGPPHFVEVSHRTGVAFPPEVAAGVDRFTTAVLAALRMRTGLVHLEFRMPPAGPTLMEVAVRTPGDYLMELLGLTYEVDWFELVVRAALALPLPPGPRRPVRYAASYLPSASPGTVTEVSGLDEVAAHDCVVDAAVSVAPGDVVTATRSSAERVGHVVLSASCPAELEGALAFVRRTLVVSTSPEGPPDAAH